MEINLVKSYLYFYLTWFFWLAILDSTNNVEKSTEKDGIDVIKKIIDLHVHLKVLSIISCNNYINT